MAIVRSRRPIPDVALVLGAAATMAGAWRAVPVPIVLVVAVLLAAFLTRRPLVLVVAALVLGSAAGDRSWAAVAPAPPGAVGGAFVVRADPDDLPGVTRFDVVEDGGSGRRFEVWTSGARRREAAELQVGDAVWIEGAVTPRPAGADWLARRHVVGRVRADRLLVVRYASGLAGGANRARRLLGIGGASLAPDARALLSGFVLGDDRAQSDDQADAFRRAGMSHLLVVSGQNVAFLLLAVRPVLRWLGPRGRVVLIGGVLWGFATLTRWEPSVLRATAMAAVAVAATARGRPLPPHRVLSIAVGALVLLDPLVAGAYGFVLSVAATAGIVVLAGPLAERLPGPAAVRDAVAVTVAAQVAVTPVLASLGATTTLVSIPANVVAVPVAGPLMAWGLLVGVPAGVLAEHGASGAAAAFHLPTRAGVWWIDRVAQMAARVPSRPVPTAAVLLAGVGLLAITRAPPGHLRRARGLVVVAALLPAVAIGLAPPAPPPPGVIGEGALAVWTTRTASGGNADDGRDATGGTGSIDVAVIDGRVQRPDVLAARRTGRLGGAVLVVVTSASPTASAAAAEVCRGAATVVRVLVPVGSSTACAGTGGAAPVQVVDGPVEESVGELVVRVAPSSGGTRLVATVSDP